MKREVVSIVICTFVVMVNLLIKKALGEYYYYEKEFLEEHNKARIRAGMAPFTYDERLAEFARKHASSHARDCALRHSDGPYGENLFWGNAAKSLKWAPKDAVNAWMNEQKYYNRKTNKCMTGQKCGHYTQIMWRDTKRVGCAMSNCKGKSTYIVCEYDPPGNFQGLSPFDKHDPFIYTATTAADNQTA